MMKGRVRLLTIEGDIESFADLIGKDGWLEDSNIPGDIRFHVTNDFVTLKTRRVERLGSEITIETVLGNTFLLKVL